MTPLEQGQSLYATMTLVYGAADELVVYASRNHPLLRFLHRSTDPAVGTEYWLRFGPPETAETSGTDQSIEAHIMAAHQFLSALRLAIEDAKKTYSGAA